MTQLWNQLAPIYVVQSLDFDSTETGIVMAVGAASLSIFTFFIQPYFLKRYKYKPLSIVFSLLLFFTILLMPSVSLLKNDNPNNIYVLLICASALHASKYAFASIIFVTTLCFMNNSVPPSQCGRVNGIGQSLSALMRGIGPITGGAIWSWSMTLDGTWMERYKAFPAYLFTFLFLIITTFCLSCLIKSDMQKPWEDKIAEKHQKRIKDEEQDDFEGNDRKTSQLSNKEERDDIL